MTILLCLIYNQIVWRNTLKNIPYRPPGGTRVRLIGDSKPILHPWNKFTVSEKKRKSPAARGSPSSKKKLVKKLMLNVQEEVVPGI